MKVKSGFVTRQVMGEMVAVPTGEAAKTFHGMIKLNATAYEIWKGLEAEQSIDSIVQHIIDTYEVDEEKAKADVADTVEQLLAAGALEE